MDSFTEVFAWGSDQTGQLGLGGSVGKTYSSPRLCSFNVLIKEISCGEEHAGFISSQGHIYTMGSNSDGRLGINDHSISYSSSPCLVSVLSSFTSLKIACGWGHTAVILNNGKVYAWGVGEFGALGNAELKNLWTPQEMLLPDNFEPFDVSCGSRHSAVLSKNGKLAMVGCGEAGQLGTKKREKETVPVIIDAENVLQVACGVFHTGYLTTKGAVFMMGGNSFGQLGMGNKKSTSYPERVKALDGVYISKIACGYHSAAICDKGCLYIWGTGTFGEHLLPYKVHFQSRVKEVAIGGTFTVVALQDMRIFAWGNNTNGELGLSDYDQRASPVSIVPLEGKKITRIACGGSFCIALGSDIGSARTPTRHIRSFSKTEHTEKQSYSKFSEARPQPQPVSPNIYKSEVLKLEELLNDEKVKNERLRLELEDSNTQISKLATSCLMFEKNYKNEENSILKLQEENQQLLIRLQEIQIQYKNANNEAKSAKDENYNYKRSIEILKQDHLNETKVLKDEVFSLKRMVEGVRNDYFIELKGLKEENSALIRTIEEIKHEDSMELEEIVKKVYEEREFLNKKVKEEQEKLSKELQNRGFFEKSYQQVLDENSKLKQNIEELYREIDRIQSEIKHQYDEEILRKSYEKEAISQQLYAKDTEIESISNSYHELMIQLNRLLEENKIYKLTNQELEEKNQRLFENLEKELAARAKDYKERTLSMLATPLAEREIRRSISPVRVQSSASPLRSKLQTSEIISRTKLSETTQAKIGNTAARLLARMENESALSNIRISSPSRRSPERPIPYKSHQVSKEIREALRSKLLEYRD